MSIRSDDPLRKVTLNLYAEDVQWLIHTYGHGWTERIRQHIHTEVTKHNDKPEPCAHFNARVWFYRGEDTYMICEDCNTNWRKA